MTDLSTIEREAKMLMTAHGVGSLAFAFDNGKRRIAACHVTIIGKGSYNEIHIPHKITLSRHYAALLTIEEIRDTMLHEIAHALTPGDGHGAKWKSKARELGIKPDRCKAASARPEAPVKGMCPKCDKVISETHRLPLRVYFHKTCGRKFPLRYFKDGRLVRLNDMPARYRAEFARSFS